MTLHGLLNDCYIHFSALTRIQSPLSCLSACLSVCLSVYEQSIENVKTNTKKPSRGWSRHSSLWMICFVIRERSAAVTNVVYFSICVGGPGGGSSVGGADKTHIKHIGNSVQFWRIRIYLSIYLYSMK